MLMACQGRPIGSIEEEIIIDYRSTPKLSMRIAKTQLPVNYSVGFWLLSPYQFDASLA